MVSIPGYIDLASVSENFEPAFVSCRHLFDVAQYSPAHSAKCMQQIVKDIHKHFTENRDGQGEQCLILLLSCY